MFYLGAKLPRIKRVPVQLILSRSPAPDPDPSVAPATEQATGTPAPATASDAAEAPTAGSMDASTDDEDDPCVSSRSVYVTCTAVRINW